MNSKTITFLKNLFRRYYFKNAHRIEFPDRIQEREIGYMDFEGVMVRHLSYNNEGELVAEIIKRGPASVYCSNARYQSPSLPIEEKGWKGAELIFDIDSDQIKTKCRETHDMWYCINCKSAGRIPFPALCPNCKSSIVKIKGRCSTCIDAAYHHAQTVISILKEDFGVNEDCIRLYFSGNRGFHIHVFDPRFYFLNQDARLEIALYVRGETLPPPKLISLNVKAVHETTYSGWLRRISNNLKNSKGKLNSTRLIASIVASYAAKVDQQVTSDIHRIFRMAGTLHNQTGLLKMRLSKDKFDPNFDPVVIDDEKVKISVKYYPPFTLKGVTFGPFKNETIQIPAYASVPILTSGLGESL
jgi:DNA primase small subunit